MRTESPFHTDRKAGVGLGLQKIVVRSIPCARLFSAACGGLMALSSLNAQTNSAIRSALSKSREKIMLPLGSGLGESTAFGYLHKGPPPWENGNCLAFSFGHKKLPGRVKEGEQLRCYAVNIHSENLHDIAKKLKLKTLEAEVFHKQTYMVTNFFGARAPEVIKVESGYCIITDARILRKWFRPEKPGCGCVSSED